MSPSRATIFCSLILGVLFSSTWEAVPVRAGEACERLLGAVPPDPHPEALQNDQQKQCEAAWRTLPDAFCLGRPEAYVQAYLEHYRVPITAYTTQCLHRDLAYLRANHPSTLALVGSLTGVITVPAGGGEKRFQCMAFRVDTEAVITARHCVQSRDGRRFDLTLMRFTLLNAPDEEFGLRFASDFSPMRAWALTDDWVLLEADTSSVPMPDGFSSANLWPAVEFGADVLLLGPNPLARLNGQKPAEVIDHALRYDALGMDDAADTSDPNRPRGTCWVQRTSEDKCLVYSCNTLPGFSGAPVFAKAEVKPFVRLVGIHLRNGFGPGGCGQYQGRNVGIVLPIAVVDRTRKDKE